MSDQSNPPKTAGGVGLGCAFERVFEAMILVTRRGAAPLVTNMKGWACSMLGQAHDHIGQYP